MTRGVLRLAKMLRMATWVENFIAPTTTDLRCAHDGGKRQSWGTRDEWRVRLIKGGLTLGRVPHPNTVFTPLLTYQFPHFSSIKKVVLWRHAPVALTPKTSRIAPRAMKTKVKFHCKVLLLQIQKFAARFPHEGLIPTSSLKICNQVGPEEDAVRHHWLEPKVGKRTYAPSDTHGSASEYSATQARATKKARSVGKSFDR